VTLIVAEPAAGAVRYGCAPGRDFRLRLTGDVKAVRVEAAGAGTEHLPAAALLDAGAGAGRGLPFVARSATR
jgi:hypothetical protein